jgi:cyclopropane fatty-acyl-phospholipid synthase-like methyltransferase
MQQRWEEFYKSHNYFHLQPHEALESFSQKSRSRDFNKILDLGCGSGKDLLFLAKRGFNVQGVDFSPAAAANAEDLLQSENLPGKVYVDNLFDKVTNFEENEFDAVVAINSLQYTDIQIFKTTIAEVSRILRDNGLFLLVVSSPESKLQLEVEEQIFFEEEKLTSIVTKRFSILDFGQDKDKNYVAILEKN